MYFASQSCVNEAKLNFRNKYNLSGYTLYVYQRNEKTEGGIVYIKIV